MVSANQTYETALTTISEIYSEWCDDGSRRVSAMESLEAIGEILENAGFLEEDDSDDDGAS
jgi:hypothetical protein